MRTILLALGGACAVLALASTVHADGPAKRQVFEYKALETGPINPSKYDEEFNKLGKDGWELVASNEFAFVFKRPQQP